MAGLYIHIPFCASRCIYCGFYSTTLLPLQDRYVDALCREMELRDVMPINTVYIGGGTPSQLSSDNLRKLLYNIYKVYGLNSTGNLCKEITMECNPDDINETLCATISELHINRVSMGAQTFSNQRLRFLHRRHSARQVTAAVKQLRQHGISNISIDLMFGFPGETLSDWERDIDEALALNVEHISAYSLMYEEGTPLYENRDKWREIDEELSLSMYEMLIDKLTSAGYEHYEISNFAKPGFRSLHNSSYWDGTPYIGIGASAHSYDIVSRQWNISDIKRYIESIERGIRPCDYEVIDEATRYNDLVTTALRTRDGVNIEALPEVFKKHILACAEPYIQQKKVSLRDNRLRLTREGLFISDSIMSDLMWVTSCPAHPDKSL